VCAADCSTQRFLDWLEEPLMAWEVEEDKRLRQRRKDLMRGIIPA
jgi:L-alanine-DL-glutamate epimerase-like enolase superfamily enzyme